MKMCKLVYYLIRSDGVKDIDLAAKGEGELARITQFGAGGLTVNRIRSNVFDDDAVFEGVSVVAEVVIIGADGYVVVVGAGGHLSGDVHCLRVTVHCCF